MPRSKKTTIFLLSTQYHGILLTFKYHIIRSNMSSVVLDHIDKIDFETCHVCDDLWLTVGSELRKKSFYSRNLDDTQYNNIVHEEIDRIYSLFVTDLLEYGS